MRLGRLVAFIAIVLAVLGLTASTSLNLWKGVRLGLDLQGGFDLLYKIEATKDNPLTKSGIDAALQAVQLRVNSLGVASPVIELENGDEIRVQLAGAFDQATAEKVIGETADLRIYGNVIKTKTGLVPDEKTLLIQGKDIKSNAHWATDQFGNNVVDLTMKDAGRWAEITKQYLHKPIYTFLNGQLLMGGGVVVNDIIANGETQISLGPNATPQDCQNLAKLLNSGALPYPLKPVSSMSVGPSLGQAALHATMWAGLFAIILIFAFMMILYRMAGFIANIALVAYAYLTLLTFNGMHVVLTLPGLAALVLGIGMAVDANIITYERIKDEVRNGKSLQSSIIAGNKRALRTIIDSNATTFIAGAVMYWFGQGDIRGFAVALMISIVVSLITAVLLSRLMLMLFAKANVVRKPWWYGARKGVANA
jgi:preprotein translocase subunit SecD